MSMIDFLMRRPVDLTLPSGFKVRVLPMSLADVAATAEEPDTYRRLAMTVQRSVCTEDGGLQWTPEDVDTLMTEMDGKAMIEISNAIAQLTNPGAFDAPLSGSPSTTPETRRISVSEALAEPWAGIVAYMGMEAAQAVGVGRSGPLPEGMTPAVFEALKRRRERDNG